MKINDLETPCILLDKEAVIKNINRVQKIANKQNLKLKPHIKTHKSPFLFNWQQQAGAIGITASKVDEAIPFIKAGVQSVTLAYPIVDQRKLDRLLDQISKSNHEVSLTICVDSLLGYEVANAAANKAKYAISIHLIIDIGYERCGLDPKDPMVLELAKKITDSKFIQLAGLLTHNGLTYGAKSKKHIGKLNASEIKQLLKVKKQLEKKNLPITDISVGSTPGVLSGTQTLTGATELRPGNYIFMDRTPYELGLINKNQIAISVLSQIISENNHYYIIDAGKKVLSSDQREGVEDYGLVYPYNKLGKRKKELRLVKMSEEHGFVRKTKNCSYKVGDKLRIIPNHSCVVANLASEYCLLEGDSLLRTIPIAANRTSHGINQF